MRFHLRTLLILLALAPPILAAIGIAVFGLRQEPPTAFGTVTYRGMPVEGGTIHFVPQANDRSSIAAKTDAQGRFRVNGDASGRPLKPGRYRMNIDFPEYGKSRKSELMVELRPKSANQFDFDLQ